MSKKIMMPYQLAASLVCADMMQLGREIKLLEKARIGYIHFDVMDGVFVPRYGLHPEILQALRKITLLPVDVHLMVTDPEPYIEIFAASGATIITVHVEACAHLHRTLYKIKKTGVKAGVALNPATPLSVLDYLWDDIDLVMLMAINPGIVGHKLIPGAMQKIKDLKEKIGGRKIIIEIDGGVTTQSAPLMIRAGAHLLVCGSSTIFRPDANVLKKTKELHNMLDKVLVEK